MKIKNTKLRSVRYLFERRKKAAFIVALIFGLLWFLSPPPADPNYAFGQERQPRPDGPPPFMNFFKGGRGKNADLMLVEKFDSNKDGWLNSQERKKAREEAKKGGRGRRGPGRGKFRGGPGGENNRTGTTGKKVSKSEVKSFEKHPLYDTKTLRTIFIDFPNDQWESELEDFKSTDVEVPADVTVDGKKYSKVGIKFRGNSSYMRVPRGLKRSLNLSFNMADKDQRLYGYRTLNLLNGHGDPSYLSSVLYSQIASNYIPVPKANFVKVVINGEYWGIYSNVQQINKDFIRENYSISKGSRWKVPGRPGADGGLRYLGEGVEPYKSRYELKTKDRPEAWQALVELCRILHETPAKDLPTALKGKLDVDGALRFLAIDLATVNSDGYWTRASDYCLFLDSSGKFHVIPYDMNEAFMTSQRGGRGRRGGMEQGGRRQGGREKGGRGKGNRDWEDRGRGRRQEGERGRQKPGDRRGGEPPEGRPPMFGFGFGGPGRGGPESGGPGFGGRGFGGPGGGKFGHGSTDLDPLASIGDGKKALHAKLLAVPEWKEKYLGYVKSIAKHQMDWEKIGRQVANFRSLISNEIQQETRSESTHRQFLNATEPTSGSNSLKSFFEKRRSFLLNHKEVKSVSLPVPKTKTERSSRKDGTVAKTHLRSIRISELMAANSKFVRNPDGNFEDWIEIHNNGSSTVDLSNFYLSDKEQNLALWKFPNNTKINPGQYLVVWADDVLGKGLHCNFKLKKKGESVFLAVKSGNRLRIVDQVQFGKQTDGVSWGRLKGKWQSLSPTAGSQNSDQPPKN